MSPRLGELVLGSVSDERLVKLARAGHERAFAVIVERYRPELSALARRLSPDGKAEDIVQQAFLSAFAALRAGADVKHLRGWLYRIVRNAAARSQAPLYIPLDGATASDESVEDVVAQRALAIDALAELSRLPVRQRQAIVGTALDGRGRAEVATSMGVTEGAVRQLVHRARVRIRTAVTAVAPLPLVRWLAPGHPGNGGAVNVAAGIGTGAASSGAALKLGLVLASGAIATGVAAVDIHGGAQRRVGAGPLAAAPVVHPRAARDDDQVLTVDVVARVPVQADRPHRSDPADSVAVAAPTSRARRGGDLPAARADRHKGRAASSTLGSDRGDARGAHLGGRGGSYSGRGGGSHPGHESGSRPGGSGGSHPGDGDGSHPGDGGGSGRDGGPAGGQGDGGGWQNGVGSWDNGGGGPGRDGHSTSGPVAVVAGDSGATRGGEEGGFGGSGAGSGSGYHADSGTGPGSGSYAGSGAGPGSGYGAGPAYGSAPGSAPGSGTGSGTSTGVGSVPGSAADSGLGAGPGPGSASGAGPGPGSGPSASPDAVQGGSSSPDGSLGR